MKRSLSWVFCLLLLSGLNACNEPKNPSSYKGSTLYARVSVHVNSQLKSQSFSSENRFRNALTVPTPNRTALVVAVPSETLFSEDYNSIAGSYDKALIDLTTSTVTLTLPLNTPIQLFEYTFIQSYTLADLTSSTRSAFSKAVLGPFTLSESTTTLELNASLEFAVDNAFDDMITAGTFDIDDEEDNGVEYFLYEKSNWQTGESTTFIFNTVTRSFEEGSSPRTAYELINNQWIQTSGGPSSATVSSIDQANQTVYFTNPDFSAKLVGLVDLTVTGFIGHDDEGGDDGSDGDSTEEDKQFMTADDFSPGALGYILEVNGLTESAYRLDRIKETHDCNNTQFTSLSDMISNHTTNEFTCQNHGEGPCLSFENYTNGQTSGNVLEVIRDENHNVIGTPQVAGTWEIATVQTKEILLVHPDSTDYLERGMYAPFWSVYDGAVWEGYRPVGSSTESVFYHVTYNAAAVSDFTRFLQTAPEEFFISEFNNQDSCSQGYWDQDSWDNFVWAP